MPNTRDVITNTFRATRGTRRYEMTPFGARLVYTPMKGFWKSATCADVACTHYLQGWSLPLDFSPMQKPEDLLAAQGAHQYIVDSGREFSTVWDGSRCIYQFPPGQTCYRTHRLPVERDPVFLHIKGPDRFNRVDYDEFHDTYNENAHRANQNAHIREG